MKLLGESLSDEDVSWVEFADPLDNPLAQSEFGDDF